jgi:hypothetical protein
MSLVGPRPRKLDPSGPHHVGRKCHNVRFKVVCYEAGRWDEADPLEIESQDWQDAPSAYATDHPQQRANTGSFVLRSGKQLSPPRQSCSMSPPLIETETYRTAAGS